MLGWSSAPNRLIGIVNNLSEEDFEDLTVKLLTGMRFKITDKQPSPHGMDFEASREDEGKSELYFIRAIRGSKMVTPEELQLAVGKKKEGRDMSPVFISTAGFTEDASKYADLLNISLADGEKLTLLLKKFDLADDLEKGADLKVLEVDGDRFLPSIDELESNMHWGNDFYGSGNFKKAIEYYDKALSLKSSYDLAWMMKGNAFGSMGRHEEAIDCFRKVLEYNPENTEAWYNMGATLYNLERYDEEIQCYDRALEIDKDFSKAWNNKGATLHQMGKYDEAVLCYVKVLKLEPDNVKVLNNNGVALKNLKEYDDALRSFDRAIAKREDYTDAWLNKGILVHEMENYLEAVKCYDKVLVKWKSPEVLCQKGMAQMELGRFRP
ncbi:MAG: tetratricopeptide repeat protein, partial [Thermoplasmata archaeon]|nr:tetratricopeptide repeat protein [Thermoplasmata archaeon]